MLVKKIFIIVLAFFIIFAFYNNSFATNAEVDSFEYEQHHMLEHKNAEIQEKFNTYAPVILITLIIFNSIVFGVLSKKYNKITSKYIIVLLIIGVSYIISCIYIKNKYPSNLAIVPIKQYVCMAMISFSVIVGIFISKNRLRLIISSIPAIVVMLFITLDGFTSYANIQSLLEDFITALKYFTVIEILTQIILSPIYLTYKNKHTND